MQTTEQSKCLSMQKNMKLLTCFLIALPTSLMTPLAALNIDFTETSSLDDLRAAISEKSWPSFAFAALSFVGAQHTLFSLNQLFLFKAFSTMSDFFVASYSNVIHRKKMKELMIGWSSFCWCVLTSLIFGENGKDTLAFFPGGSYIGFSLSFVVHFVTRYESVVNELNLKQTLFINNGAPPNTHPKAPPYDKKPCQNAFSFLWTVFSLAVVWFCYSPGLIQGFNTLFNTDIGEHNNYRDPLSMSLSTFALLPTLAFYMKAIYGCLQSLHDSYDVIINQSKTTTQFYVALLFAFDFFSAIVTALGYELIAKSAVDGFELNQPTINESMPYLLVGSIASMLITYLFSIRMSGLASTEETVLTPQTPLLQQARRDTENHLEQGGIYPTLR